MVFSRLAFKCTDYGFSTLTCFFSLFSYDSVSLLIMCRLVLSLSGLPYLMNTTSIMTCTYFQAKTAQMLNVCADM